MYIEATKEHDFLRQEKKFGEGLARLVPPEPPHCDFHGRHKTGALNKDMLEQQCLGIVCHDGMQEE